MNQTLSKNNIFVDPTPVSAESIMQKEAEILVGSGAPVVVIITCGGKLGSWTIVTVGTAVVTVAD